MKPLLATALALTLALPLPARAVELGSMTGAWPAAGTRRIDIEFPAGRMTLQPSATNEIRATLDVRCEHGGRNCYEQARRIRLITDVVSGTRTIHFEPHSWKGHGLRMDLTIEVPAGMEVRTEMGAGRLEVIDLASPLDLNLGAGDVKIRMPEDMVRSVDASVGLGDASLRRGGRTTPGRGFLAKTLHWSDGRGAARVKVSLGVGDVFLRLD
jgi:hypothetical protein